MNVAAWSDTTELFRKTSQLLDPPRGRGFYNTFSAHHWYIRFPPDYLFFSEDFGLVIIQRMRKNGSDHFATLTHLCLKPELAKKQDAPKANAEELQEARKMASLPVKVWAVPFKFYRYRNCFSCFRNLKSYVKTDFCQNFRECRKTLSFPSFY